MNNIGPRTEPYGTPWMLTQGGDNDDLIFTEKVLYKIKDINQLWIP